MRFKFCYTTELNPQFINNCNRLLDTLSQKITQTKKVENGLDEERTVKNNERIYMKRLIYEKKNQNLLTFS